MNVFDFTWATPSTEALAKFVPSKSEIGSAPILKFVMVVNCEICSEWCACLTVPVLWQSMWWHKTSFGLIMGEADGFASKKRRMLAPAWDNRLCWFQRQKLPLKTRLSLLNGFLTGQCEVQVFLWPAVPWLNGTLQSGTATADDITYSLVTILVQDLKLGGFDLFVVTTDTFSSMNEFGKNVQEGSHLLWWSFHPLDLQAFSSLPHLVLSMLEQLRGHESLRIISVDPLSLLKNWRRSISKEPCDSSSTPSCNVIFSCKTRWYKISINAFSDCPINVFSYSPMITSIDMSIIF